MQITDLTGIAILWCLGLLASVLAINARGAIRLSLSAIAAVVIFAVAGIFSYMKVSSYEAFVSSSEPPQAVFATRPSAMPAGDASKKDRIRKNATVSAEAENSLGQYAASARKIADEAIALVAQINDFREIASGATEQSRETAESKALAIRNATAKVNRQAESLFHPRSASEIHQGFVHATESLRLAGYALHAYTTLDDREEQRAQYEQSKNQADIAQKALESYRAKLTAIAER